MKLKEEVKMVMKVEFMNLINSNLDTEKITFLLE